MKIKNTFYTLNPELKTLRKLANFIGTQTPEDAIEFLEDCGVPLNLIKQNEQSSKIIYHALKELTSSGNQADYKLLVKVISESINPALYNAGESTEKAILDQYNQWLKDDGLELISTSEEPKYTIIYPLPKTPEERSSEREEIRKNYQIETDIISNILTPYLSDIAEIKVAYDLIVKLIDTFSENSFPVDKNLDNYYIKLFNLVKNKMDRIQVKLKEAYENDRPFNTPHDYINPHLYENSKGQSILFQPFPNLYLAQKVLKDKESSWDDIKKQLEVCFGYINDISSKFSNKTDNLSNQKFFDEITDYLKYFTKIDYKDYFGFEGTKFWLKRIAASDLIITFVPKDGKVATEGLCFLEAIVDFIKGFGQLNAPWLKGIVPKAIIINYVQTNHKTMTPPHGDWDNWLKQSKNALKQKMTDIDNQFVVIDAFSRKENGYPISIRLPINDSSTP